MGDKLNFPKLAYVVAITFSLTAFPAAADNLAVQILSATVKDQRIAGASVILQKNGATSATGTTNDQGLVSLHTEFPDGDGSLIIVKKAGYSNLVAKCPCKGMTYALSPVMTDLDGIRIVLNWGAAPRDLDSHLVFRQGHVFYLQRDGNYSEKIHTGASLDVDHTDGFGPETITIAARHPGEPYVYAVHALADMKDPDSAGLSRSQARVFVYVGQSLVRSYYVPNQVGNLWTVFRITPEGEFQDINTVTNHANLAPGGVAQVLAHYVNSAEPVEESRVTAAETSSADSLNKLGEQAYHAGNIEDAIDLYRQAIDIAPNFGQAYSNLGLAHAKVGHTAEAIWANRKAIALASGPTAATVRASSHYNIARIYENAGQYTTALQQYESASREKPSPVYDKAIERVKAFMK